MREVIANIHSKKNAGDSTGSVLIVEQKSNNEIIVKYEGYLCSAIYNPFTCMYYVDDIYGVLSKDNS